MAILTHGLETIEVGATGWRTILNTNLTALDPGRFTSGLFASRPAAGTANRYYFATDTLKIYYDTGVVWLEVGSSSSSSSSESSSSSSSSMSSSSSSSSMSSSSSSSSSNSSSSSSSSMSSSSSSSSSNSSSSSSSSTSA